VLENAMLTSCADAYFQPTAQSYPTQNGGATFPDTAGQAFSIPDAANSVSRTSTKAYQNHLQ
jgi:hypothetical protein